MTTSSCIFCRIVRGEIPAEIIIENESTIAFRDINGQAPTHILVIPRNHIENLSELGQEITAISETVRAVVEKESIVNSGFRVVLNQGDDAGQEVDHIHFHVLGGRKLAWPPG